jgi:hypothetical protein
VPIIRRSWLVGKLVAGSAPPVEDIEGKYGTKLDRMLGGLAARE